MATALSDKFHKNPEFYSRLAKNLETALNIILSGTIEILSCITPNKKILYIFRNFMVYLGKHTMPVFLFKGGLAALSGAECDIRENLYTNECPNIFVSTKLHE